MDGIDIIAKYGVFAGTYVFCVISGFVPVVNAEIFLIIISCNINRQLFLPVLLLATIGQMTAKVVLFLSGRGILKLSLKKFEIQIRDVTTKMQKWESKIDVFLFLSAFTGFPPFYIVTVVAGMSQHNFIRFFISGFLGRLFRFGLIMMFPQIYRDMVS